MLSDRCFIVRRRRRAFSARLRAFALAAIASLCWMLSPALATAGDLDFPQTDYTLRSIDGSQVIGHAHFSATTDRQGLTTLSGDYRYLNGEYDTDESTMRPGVAGKPPTLVRTHHSFYLANGSPERESRVEIATGTGVCTVYIGGKPQVSSEKFKFPSDTWAGDAVMLPLRRFVNAGGKGSTSFFAFNCIPGPKLLKVTVTARPPAPWNYYPGNLVQVDVKPDFGWINVVIAPFLPEIRAWFNPGDNSFFVGCETARYYKGLKYLMVHTRSDDAQLRAEPKPKSSP
jgi:hypothetical protein